MHDARRVVSIVQRRLTHYRVPLFDSLREKLAADGVALRLLHGQGTRSERERLDDGVLDWAEPLRNRYVMGSRACWHDLSAVGRESDLLIVTQENALLANHFLLASRSCNLAFWGHGANFQEARRDHPLERYKRWTSRQVDWWFAYTAASVARVAESGFPGDRITCLNNAMDVDRLRAGIESVTRAETDTLRGDLGLAPGFTGAFLGSFHAGKRLPFLFEAADRIRAAHPQFNLLIIGAGPEEPLVRSFASRRPWVVTTGPLRDRGLARHLALADVMLNPGLVGLNILDAFACRLPMLTTDCESHSPEIAYLETSNGIIAENTVLAFAAAVLRLAREPGRIASLRRGADESAALYTIDAMANRFADGICRALAPSVTRPRCAA